LEKSNDGFVTLEVASDTTPLIVRHCDNDRGEPEIQAGYRLDCTKRPWEELDECDASVLLSKIADLIACGNKFRDLKEILG
jgi:hypothetical protein